MTDADLLRAQIPTATDPERLEREAVRVDLQEACRHIDTLTRFYMDNILWTRAAEQARAFANRVKSGQLKKPIKTDEATPEIVELAARVFWTELERLDPSPGDDPSEWDQLSELDRDLYVRAMKRALSDAVCQPWPTQEIEGAAV